MTWHLKETLRLLHDQTVDAAWLEGIETLEQGKGDTQ